MAIEIISPGNSAEDTVKKIYQYLDAGCRSVWIVYPGLRRAEIHSAGGIRHLRDSDALTEESLLPGFSLVFADVLDAE